MGKPVLYHRIKVTMTTKKIIQEALFLPIEERALIADSLLRSLNMPNTDIDARWTEVAKRRLQELRSEKVKPIPGDEVFEKALKRFSK
jgi:putative addiction module component (TIGR02574 family)